MSITIQTHPVNPAITTDLVKSHLNIIDNNDHDALFEMLYIPDVVDVFIKTTKQALIYTVVKQIFDCFPTEDYFLLERHPVALPIQSFKYRNTENQLVDVDATSYFVCETFPYTIQLESNRNWPVDIHPTRRGSVEITYKCGYGETCESIPAGIKQCLSMMLGDRFLHREDGMAVPGIVIVSPFWTSNRLMERFKTNFFEHRSQQRL